MTTVEPRVSAEQFEAVDEVLPDDFTAELINGRILVVPAPDGDHDVDVASVARQIYARMPDLWLFPERGLAVGSYRSGRARVDGAVAPHDYFRGQKSWADASGVVLALEVTSGSEAEAEVDRVEKRDAYAASGIPVYLLVDRRRRESVVHWGPVNGRYTHQASAVFGEKLLLPEPFGFELDTAEFA